MPKARCSARACGCESKIAELENKLAALTAAVAELADERLARSGIVLTPSQSEARAWQVIQEMLPGMSPVSILGRAKKKEGKEQA